MNTFWFLVVLLSPWFVFGVFLWRLFLLNKFVVDPNNIERLVIKNVLTGRFRVLGPGTWPFPPWWKEHQRVKLNREPVSDQDDQAKSSEGTRLRVAYRFDTIAGRPYDERTGALTVANPDDLGAVDDRVVLLAVTRINFAERETRVKEIVRRAVDIVLGLYTGNQLITPQEEAARQPFTVPVAPTLGGIDPEPVNNATNLYEQLEKCILEAANRGLVFVGINIVDFDITNLVYFDDELQQQTESKRKAAKLADGAEELRRRAPAGEDFTFRDAVAVLTDEDLGTVTLGEAGLAVAKAIRDARGLVNIRVGNVGR